MPVALPERMSSPIPVRSAEDCVLRCQCLASSSDNESYYGTCLVARSLSILQIKKTHIITKPNNIRRGNCNLEWTVELGYVCRGSIRVWMTDDPLRLW